MYTFPQIRARLVAAAIAELGRDGIVNRLVALGYVLGPADAGVTVRALAYRLAWRLLPAGGLYVEVADADLSSDAAPRQGRCQGTSNGGR